MLVHDLGWEVFVSVEDDTSTGQSEEGNRPDQFWVVQMDDFCFREVRSNYRMDRADGEPFESRSSW
ncbi:hypothetical protein GCM10009606_25870 [Nocardioides aquiterrae]|uniref:Uncharacterized protein n=1 Tax=Nocardioides aquiterrae TaxID=203799 RepID=A0ABN1UE22_9ACTN